MNKYLYAFLCVCFSILSANVAYSQVPVANFSASTTSGCSPIVSNFTDLSTNTPTSWYWDLGNGSTSTLQNPSTTYINPGTYTVTLIATNSNGADTQVFTNYITVAPSPTVMFTADSTPSCQVPRTISFTNNSVAGGTGTTTYLWDFGDGNTSTSANPTHTYTAFGNYTVTLLVTNGNSCSKSLIKSNYIKILPKPTASFTATGNNSCTSPVTTTFTNTSTGAISYDWSFGDGGTSTATNPTHTYTANGSYTVRLIATNAAGCKDTFTSSSLVNIGAPNASFNVSSLSVCTGKTVNFTNTSTPAGYTSAWSFGTGGTSTSTSPTYTYSSAGTYTVTLIVSKSGCSDTDSKTITVNQNPTINFTGSPTEACAAPLTTNFTNSTTNAVSYLWRFGDGNTSTSANPSNTYNALGNYSVKLIATSASGCTDSFTRTNYVKIQQPTATINVGSYSGCAPVTISFTASVTTLIPVSNYTWDFGDGSATVSCSTCNTQSHTYTSSGTYTVTLTYTTGSCTLTRTTAVNIATKPTAAFSASPTALCPGSPVTFTNSSTGATGYTWLFGNGGTSTATNPVYNGYTRGVYTVMLIANNNGCRDTATRTNYITVHPPEANFGLATSCTNRYTVTLTDSSVGANTYSWDFGDGNTSTQIGGTLTHTYSTPGTRTITLNVYNTTYGCSSTVTRTVNVQPLSPVFTVSDTTLCKGESTMFSITTSGSGNSYTWHFGNSVTFSTGASTVYYAYPAGGTYSPKLVVTDANGCKDSLTKTNHIRVGSPNVDFSGTPLLGCLPFTATFTDLSTPNGGFTITGKVWDFVYGGPQPTTSNTISYTYIYGGSWPVKLVVTDANGCKDSLIKNNYITASKPVAQFSTADTNICVGQTVQMYNNSGGASFTCVWHWGDGTTSTQLTPTHTYTVAGTYTVKLVVTDMYGCMDSNTKTAYIKVNSPAIGFTMSDTVANCPPLLVNFTNTSTGVSTYAWSFGNGGQSSLSNPTALYTYPGVYNIKLIGTTNAGCKDSLTKQVTIYGPTGSFTYTPIAGCNPVTVNFSATTTNATSLIWDMSNGFTQTTTGNTYSYTYTQTGKYLPKLILSDGASCLVPIFGTDTVKVDKMDADFSFSPNAICNAGTIQFTDTVLYTISNVVSRSWDFGDGGTSTSHNPSHAYIAPGNYNVRLIVTNAQGCKDTITKTVVIHTPPNITVSGASAICQGATTGVVLTASGASTYSWAPPAGLSCTNCAVTTALPTSTTTYIVTGTDANGCTDTAHVTVNVNNKPNVNATSNKSAVCIGSNATLTASGASTYVWSPVTALSCSTCVSPVATPTTSTTYIVTGTDANGCTDTGVVTINVNPLPTVSAGSNIAICNGSSTTLTGSGATSYVWTPASTLSCSTCASPVATPTATTTYTVTGTDANGCINTANVTVSVNALPTVSAGSNVAICNGSSTTLTGSGASTYVWTPASTLSCSTCVSPVATPTATTTYTVTGTDANGCSNTANVTVTVNNLPNVNAISNKSAVCIGSTATLTASGATNYVWTPTGSLSCSTCTSPIATPTTATTYTVTGTDANGCVNTATITVNVNALPVVSAGSNVTICNGLSTTLNATGASTYVWTPASTLSCSTCVSPVASPITTTTYTVTGTDANGCVNTSTVTVNVNPLPNVSAGSNVAICAGASATLGASGAISYVWTPATTLSCSTCASPVATPATTTTYTVTGTDANGCSKTSTVTVTVNSLPNVTATGNNVVCAGSSATLTGNGATSYVWTPSGSLSCSTCASPVATPSSPTTYTVTGTDANGCVDTGMITLNINAKPDVNAGLDRTICLGTSTNLSATGAVNYQWSPSTGLSCSACANPVATPATTTLYRVVGIAANGCSDTDFVNVTVNPLPNVTINGISTICAGSNTILVASGATNYVWTPAGSLSCSTCSNPTASPNTTTSYVVTGTDANGCTDTGNITITVNPLPVLQVTGAGTICEGTTVQLNAAGATNYNWSPGTSLSCTACSNPVASPSATTTYTVSGTTNGCSSTATLVVNVLPIPVLYLSQDQAICEGGSVQLNVLGAATYTWTPSTGLSCNTCADPIATPTSTTTYVVKGTNLDGCSNSKNITITVNPKPKVDAGEDIVICEGSSAQLQVTGTDTYTWTPSATLSCSTCSNPVAKPLTNTTYTVIGRDNIGCSDSDKVTVSIIERGPVTYGPDAEFCIGGSAELYATGGSSYTWIPADGLNNHQQAKVKAAPNNTTKYTVIVKQGDCFVDTGYINVTVHPLPVVELGPDVTIGGGNSTQLRAVGDNIATYSWTPYYQLSCDDCSSPVASPRRTTEYKVNVTDRYGCEGSDNITVRVLCENGQIFIPNTFTPNGDGVNDMFFPQGKGLDYVKSFRVYSRWGELVFSRDDMKINDPASGWDGTFKNTPLKPDVFVYVIRAYCESGELIELKGDISLVR
ncbi:MAG TPA: PKD domain-containing protein [Flavipsychrobacter sp.]|nr:PKD domain-containing protein [Flavipsychrobacter sp.]